MTWRVRYVLNCPVMWSKSKPDVEFQYAWCIQYRSQRRLFEAKFTWFCCSTIDSCHNNPRALWRATRQLTEPSHQQSPTVKFTAHDFASFFRDKIATIRQSTASSPQPVIQPCHISIQLQITKSSRC